MKPARLKLKRYREKMIDKRDGLTALEKALAKLKECNFETDCPDCDMLVAGCERLFQAALSFNNPYKNMTANISTL